jgi:bifunctional non-homologous end joining protein LigD
MARDSSIFAPRRPGARRAATTATSPTAASSKSKRSAEPIPRHIEPMLALLSASLPPSGDEWAFEYKWDGVRALAYKDQSLWRIESRNLLEITKRYPELTALRDALGRHAAVLDGEIVALDEHDRPSFPRLQRRMHVNDERQIARLTREVPILFVLFDLLYLDGESLLRRPYRDRRAMLESLAPPAPHWQLTPSYVGRGNEMLQAARENALEGVVAKKIDSPYEPGRRSNCWLKVKIVARQEFVIGGWTRESTGLADRIGTMLIGYYDERGALHYAGHVGTGLVGSDHPMLIRQFEKLARTSNPFAEKLPAARRGGNKIMFLQPRLVAEVEFRRWPSGGLVQQASFKGLRRDKPAKQVVKEVPVA